MNPPLTYWHSGGDMMCAGGTVLSVGDAAGLHDLHLDEARAAAAAGEELLSMRALKLAAELSAAAEAAWRWRRAGVRRFEHDNLAHPFAPITSLGVGGGG